MVKVYSSFTVPGESRIILCDIIRTEREHHLARKKYYYLIQKRLELCDVLQSLRTLLDEVGITENIFCWNLETTITFERSLKFYVTC